MQLSEVDKILAEKFPGKYRSVSYSQVTHSDGERITTCGVYIDGMGWHEGFTFPAALDKLFGKTEEPQDIEG